MVQDTWIVAPEKDNSRAQLALSAIRQAMLRTGQHGIARFVPRANGAVQMGVLTPCLLPADDDVASSQPHCLWMNILPFTEDIRTATFASFDQSKRGPTQKQLDAMQKSVKSMRLSAGKSLHAAFDLHTRTLQRLCLTYLGNICPLSSLS